ncbi:MAG: hypothetical protein IKM27_03905 [Clostridia bacterium]|nr:hypothetical protein [Clostridia bacterium]
MERKFYSCEEIGTITESASSYNEQYGVVTPDANFISAMKYPILYKDNLSRFREHPEWICYGHPYEDIPKKQYLGTNRDGVDVYSDKYGENITERQKELLKLLKEDTWDEMVIPDEKTALEILTAFEKHEDYELLWVRMSGTDAPVPEGYRFLGYDVTDSPRFCGMFSIICDCMFICRWHGCDEGGTLFTEEFASLNENGLFSQWQHAYDYMIKYLHQPWAETGEYGIYEVYSR